MPSFVLDTARALIHQGKPAEALAQLDAVRKEGRVTPALFALMAEAFEALKMVEAAESCFREGVKKHPGNVFLANAFANHYYRTDRCAEGLHFTRTYIEKSNAPTELLLTHANLCKATGLLDEAIHIYEQVLQQDGHNSVALANLGGLFLDEGDEAKAITLFERALGATPENRPHILMQLARAHFLLRHLAKGWECHRARFGDADSNHATVQKRPFPQPYWQGVPLEGKKLLLWGEQGVGEEILYSTMLPDALARERDCIVECDPRLIPLFTRSFPGVAFVARTTPPDALLLDQTIGAQAAMGDLGALFRPSPDSFPEKITPLLTSDTQKKVALRAHYTDLKEARGLGRKIIGLSWRSKPLRHGDPKSTNLEAWGRILEGSQHLFVSLQHGNVVDAQMLVKERGWNLVFDDAVDQQHSLDDFAAQVAAMDAVITVSNTTAHMAGALAIPATVLLPKRRGLMAHWFADGETSPWYPSLRLIRQEKDGVWDSVLQRVAALTR